MALRVKLHSYKNNQAGGIVWLGNYLITSSKRFSRARVIVLDNVKLRCIKSSCVQNCVYTIKIVADI